MCRTGGRRCPGCSGTAAREAHNRRRRENRQRRQEAVTIARERGDHQLADQLASSPPSTSRRWLADAVGPNDSLTTEPASEGTSPFGQRFESVSEKVAAYSVELERRIESLGDDEHWNAYLVTVAKFHRYSFGNQLLIAAQCPHATQVAGFKKWKELGRHVNKGERAITILAPRTARVPVLDGHGNPVLDERGRPRKEVKVVGWTTAAVFDLSQTGGKDLPQPFRELTETPPAGFTEDLESAIQSKGFEVSYEPMPELRGGHTDFTDNRVVINSTLSPARRAKTLAHELGHIEAGHGTRLGEYYTGPDGCRGEMEVEAESIAYSLCRANGMSTQVGDYSGVYIKTWAAKAGPEVVRESAKNIAKTLGQILTNHRWANQEGTSS